MDNKFLTDEEKIVFQEINNYLRHIDHILWTVTSLFVTFNLLSFREMSYILYIKWLTFLLLTLINIIALLFSISIIMIDIDLAKLSETRAFKVEKLAEVLKFKLYYLRDLKKLKQAILAPWGFIASIITAEEIILWTIVIFFK